MEIALLISLLLLSALAIYQTKVLRETTKERNELQSRVSDIEDGVDRELKEKRETISKLKKEIEELHKKAQYIKVDQVELNKEYEYLKERNSKLEHSIHHLEDRLRSGEKS